MTRLTRRQTINITSNLALTISGTIGALLPPLNWLSLVNAGLAGCGAAMTIVWFVDRSREQALEAVHQAFLTECEMNDLLITRLYEKEPNFQPPPRPSLH